MSSPIRVTDSGDYYECDLFFDRFVDAKKVVAEVCERYDRKYLTGINFIVVNGQYFLVMFFDVSEVTVGDLENFFALTLANYDYHVPDVTNDHFYMSLIMRADFSVLGDTENIMKKIPNDWNVYEGK
jgi:hypothetical protein